MAAKVIAIRQRDVARTEATSALLGIHDAINREVDIAWALQALVGAMLERDPDPVGRGALQVAQEHVFKMLNIQTKIGAIRASQK